MSGANRVYTVLFPTRRRRVLERMVSSAPQTHTIIIEGGVGRQQHDQASCKAGQDSIVPVIYGWMNLFFIFVVVWFSIFCGSIVTVKLDYVVGCVCITCLVILRAVDRIHLRLVLGNSQYGVRRTPSTPLNPNGSWTYL